MLNQRYQSLLEPGFRQTGWDSPTSRSQRANGHDLPIARRLAETRGSDFCLVAAGTKGLLVGAETAKMLRKVDHLLGSIPDEQTIPIA